MVARRWSLVGILCLASCVPSRPLPVYSLDPPYDLPSDHLLQYAEQSTEESAFSRPMSARQYSGCNCAPMNGLSAPENCRPPAFDCRLPSP